MAISGTVGPGGAVGQSHLGVAFPGDAANGCSDSDGSMAVAVRRPEAQFAMTVHRRCPCRCPFVLVGPAGRVVLVLHRATLERLEVQRAGPMVSVGSRPCPSSSTNAGSTCAAATEERDPCRSVGRPTFPRVDLMAVMAAMVAASGWRPTTTSHPFCHFAITPIGVQVAAPTGRVPSATDGQLTT